jgi:putative colanic acid biosynthesis UDP-glucose lipid carrier transferase
MPAMVRFRTMGSDTTDLIMRGDPPLLLATALDQGADQSPAGKDSLLNLFESVLPPTVQVLTLWLIAYHIEGALPPAYLMLSVLLFTLTFPSRTRLNGSTLSAISDIAINWTWISALLALTAFATGYHREFSRNALVAWFCIAPVAEVTATLLLRKYAPYLLDIQGPKQRAIIVGMNDQGLALAEKINSGKYLQIALCGFVDSRSIDRLSMHPVQTLLGRLDDIADVVRNYRIQLIYLSLPMASQPRILHVLDALKDTTSSIYFVPDMFVTDLIQGKTSSVQGMPVISVCETPFKGINGIIKRISDLAFSILILTLIMPMLIVLSVAVKLTSKGPAIFKQRRYGLDGKEIVVYKFRSMSVSEDGGIITQATKNDQRVTRLGAFLRKTSLDELPQFINVLQGRMSIVGPRPHAIAHNELYRKLIKGYMVRHKVKPGITGWAQVNGFRGETETLQKMQGRIDYDLDYLRNWSLRLDTRIILKTIRLVLTDQGAY